jgi:cyclase
MTGYDFKLYDIVREMTSVPMTILGGAGSLNDIKLAIGKYKTIGVAAGSIFVFKGKYRAVLINYPDLEERYNLYQLKY